MRTFLVSVVAAIGFSIFAPSALAQNCGCYYLSFQSFKCPSCNRTVQVGVCSGFANNCQNCRDAFYWIQCCPNQYVGSATSTGICTTGPAGLGPVQLARKLEGAIPARILLSTCSGKYVSVQLSSTQIRNQ